VTPKATLSQACRRWLAPLLVSIAIATTGYVGTAVAKSRHAAFAIDANTGDVLHASSADAPRYPASLTKMMTLYLVFEQMEAGKLNGKSRIRISKHAASVSPSKLDLEPGEEISVDDAILALVTKSANDVAVALAEHIGGTETNFARLMTAKARKLGMANTTFRNASGLPDPEQVTTARDMVTLALRLQDDFPRHYRVFATRSFTYHGHTYRNHNRLLFSFKGIDGIKTGYTRASGFNLVSSVHRDGRHVVAAVFGSKSAAARNVYMGSLLQRALARAKTRKTRRPALVASAPAPKPARRRHVATADKALPPAPPAEAGSSVHIDVAKVRQVIVSPRPQPTAPAQPGPSPADRIAAALQRPGMQQPSQPEQQVASAEAAQPSPAPLAFASTSTSDAIGGFIRGLPPSTLNQQAQALSPPPDAPPRGYQTASLTPPAPQAAPPRNTANTSGSGDENATGARGTFQIQVGAYAEAGEATRALASVAQRAPDILGGKSPLAIPVQVGERRLYRARFAGFDARTAAKACTALRDKQIDCFVMKAE
jgi:D-alanyl-D-alanine carboxypeptidase